jgi:hypothetical protein
MKSNRFVSEYFNLVVNTSNLVQYHRLMKQLKTEEMPMTTLHPIIQIIQLFDQLPDVNNDGFKYLLQFLVNKVKAMKYDTYKASYCFLFCMQNNNNVFRKLCLLLSFRELTN